ncbi:MAG: hypothetical protein COC17_08420 [Hyphomicrobiales bacterium]|nr:MAG: hypothetical protein COC17_08420 [Hyphomicrobiales bacterium]
MVKILFYPICVIVSLIVLANTFSVALQGSNPETAIWLNPLNVDARLKLVSKKIRQKDFSKSSELNETIQTGRKYAPINARLISLDGIYHEKIGSNSKAQELFSTALAILPTEYQALIYRFRYLFKKQEYVKALDIVNIVSKRWPEKQNTFTSFIPLIVLDKAGFKHTSMLFASSRQLRILIITALVRNPATISLAVQLVQNWDSGDENSYWNLGNFITRKLLKGKRYSEANLAFRSFLNAEQQANYQFIYNGNFANTSLKNQFDWTIRRQVGVVHNYKNKKIDINNAVQKPYLEIRFSGKPIQYRNVTQMLKLAPGNYNLILSYFAKKLRTPKPIKASVYCIEPSKLLATYTFDPEVKTDKLSNTPFTVPARECDIAQVYLHTEFVAKSWRNRFSGILGINNISIEQAVN